MRLVLEFDCDADIVDVPQFVIENKEFYRKRFIKWLYNKNTKHKYWVQVRDSNGNSYYGLRYRGDAFVEWLNKRVLGQEDQMACVVEQNACDYPNTLPTLFF